MKNIIKKIRRCIAFCSAGFHQVISDRNMLITDLFVATIVPFLIHFTIWSYVLSDGGSIQHFTLPGILSYIGLSIIISRLNNPYDLIYHFSFDVRYGNLDPKWTRPFSLFNFKLGEFVGGSIIYFFAAICIVLIYVFMFPQPSYYNPFFWILVILNLIMAQVLVFSMAWIFAWFSLVFKAPNFLSSLFALLSTFLGGEFLPASLWPDIPFLKTLMLYNPFHFVIGSNAIGIIEGNIDGLMKNTTMLVGYIVVFQCIVTLLRKYERRLYKGAGG